MTVTTELPSDIEADLVGEARWHGLELPQYVEHLLREWVHNEADIDKSRVVWALDLGAEEDAKLRAYYPNRTAWIVEPDAIPPQLRPYSNED